MSRKVPLAFFVSLLFMAGCANRALTPYIGRWTGGFDVSSVNTKMPVSSPSRNGWKGFIQLYLTDSRCSMHLEGEQEAVDLKGNWTMQHRQIQVRFSDVKIDDAGGAEERDPNKAFILPQDIQAAFSIPLTLDVKGNGKSLQSPLVAIGPLMGTYQFSKDTLGR